MRRAQSPSKAAGPNLPRSRAVQVEKACRRKAVKRALLQCKYSTVPTHTAVGACVHSATVGRLCSLKTLMKPRHACRLESSRRCLLNLVVNLVHAMYKLFVF